MANQNIEILRKKTYLTMIENSVGTEMFRSVFVRFKDSGEEKDIFEDGEHSCAAFVTGVLTLNKLLDEPSATVARTRKKLLERGWQEVQGTPQSGDVLFWPLVEFEAGDFHEHVGFAVNGTEAVSTSYKKKEVIRHNNTYDGTRLIELILRAPEYAFKS